MTANDPWGDWQGEFQFVQLPQIPPVDKNETIISSPTALTYNEHPPIKACNSEWLMMWAMSKCGGSIITRLELVHVYTIKIWRPYACQGTSCDIPLTDYRA